MARIGLVLARPGVVRYNKQGENHHDLTMHSGFAYAAAMARGYAGRRKERNMIAFEKPGKGNTEKVLGIALQEAKGRNCPIVFSSNEGDSAYALLDMMKDADFAPKLVCVTHVCGFRGPGEQEMSDDTRKDLESKGVIVITAAHALTGAERSLMKKFQGVYPVAMIAESLRMLGQGTKVCVEIGAMAMDAGQLDYGQPVVALGGTGRGLDTAVLLTPAYSADILSSKIHEIYCKPSLL